MKYLLFSILQCIPFLSLYAADEAKPLKVFILAGQSNMEGHAKIQTFDYIGDDPATAPLLKQMRDASGKPTVCDNVWISYLTGNSETNGEGFGKLTAGYGSRPKPDEDGGKIGPEFIFGLTMDAALEEPVLIIKTAWGGKSLYYDFRSPSSGVYRRSPKDIEKDQYPEAQCGQYYRLMVEHVKHVLSDIHRVCPAYKQQQGFEIAGFVWLQGWNDMVNREVYPIPKQDDSTTRYADYSRWMADFIRDVRKDLNAPKMPFVIGIMGVGGAKPNEHVAAFRKAMAAPAELSEFKGNVITIETAPFWSEELGAIDKKREDVRQLAFLLKSKNKEHAHADGLMSEQQQQDYVKQFEAKLISPVEVALWERGASNAGYHYLGCAKTFAMMGKAFADALLTGAKPQNEGVSQLRVRPQYHRWHVDPGVEWIETNTDYSQLDWTIPLSQSALVLVDVWDHHYLRDTEARAEKIIDERLAPLMAACRQAHMPIIHAPSPTHAIRHPNWVGARQDSKVSAKRDDWPPTEFKNKSGPFTSYRRPTEAREGELTRLRANLKIHPKIQPVADEPVIATGDELHELCKRRGTLFLFFAGFNTNACILVRDYGTLDMSRRGYEVILVRDCTTGMESRQSQPSLSQTNGAILFLEMFGQYTVASEDIRNGISH